MLYWLNVDNHPRHDEFIIAPNGKKVCGPCYLTVDRSQEHRKGLNYSKILSSINFSRGIVFV